MWRIDEADVSVKVVLLDRAAWSSQSREQGRRTLSLGYSVTYTVERVGGWAVCQV